MHTSVSVIRINLISFLKILNLLENISNKIIIITGTIRWRVRAIVTLDDSR
jgi:hypothetical protein